VGATVPRRRVLAGLAALGGALAGCVRRVPPAGGTPSAVRRSGASLVARPSVEDWPDAFRAANAAAQRAYRFAVAHRDLLEHVPCYCGCAASGHASNYACYVVAANGPVVTLDPHGFGCGTCAAITADAEALLAQGLPHRAIRERVDATWSGTGPGTKTPYPA
jgi:hypothetical protein